MEVPQQGGVLEVPGGGGGAPLSPPLSPASAAAAALANARWNPTKEQVAVLEGLYEHGLRTPTAEQIKQITVRLREHGHIEGKNVFYWFQNHKARQRQKQKQDTFAYFTRQLRRSPSVPTMLRPPGPPYPHGRLPVPAPATGMAMAPPRAAAACNNNNGGTHGVMYKAPFCMPAPQAPPANLDFYRFLHQQKQRQEYPPLYRRVVADMIPTEVQQYLHNHPDGAMNQYQATTLRNASSAPAAGANAGPSRQTLQLFPLQPTFVLPDKGRAAFQASVPTALASFSEESEGLGITDSYGELEAPALPYYDFFGLQSGGR